jgi:uncharacterized repeat protein (TIGR03803 family)
MKTSRFARLVLHLGLMVLRVHGQGTLTTLVTFNGVNGAYPCGALLQGMDGNLYGTTCDLGSNLVVLTSGTNVISGPEFGSGTLFEVITNGTNGVILTNLLLLNNASSVASGQDLAYVYAGVTQRGYNGNLYGIVEGLSFIHNSAFIFDIQSDEISNFGSSFFTNALWLTGGLIEGGDGAFYGTAAAGGPWLNDFGDSPGFAFKMSFNGEFTLLYAFTGEDDGGFPTGGLVQGGDGSFYGTTLLGGWWNAGTVFRLTTNGILTTLYSFSGSDDGYCPFAGLVQGNDGILYGTTAYGGVYDEIADGYGGGTVFKITTNGTLTTLASFSGDDGALPVAPLVKGPDGNFYGTTYTGGLNFTNGASFDDGGRGMYGAGGSSPEYSASTLAAILSQNTGLPAPPVPNGSGTIYTVTPAGALSTVYSFSPIAGVLTNEYQYLLSSLGYPPVTTNTLKVWGPTNSDGANPSAGLTLASDGTFYGVTQSGGVYGEGTVFHFEPTILSVRPQFQTVSLNGNVFSFSWNANVGTTYEVQYSTNLTGTNWENCGEPFLATNSSASASDYVGYTNSQRFYRLIASP